jgi:hypothetical protein
MSKPSIWSYNRTQTKQTGTSVHCERSDKIRLLPRTYIRQETRSEEKIRGGILVEGAGARPSLTARSLVLAATVCIQELMGRREN